MAARFRLSVGYRGLDFKLSVIIVAKTKTTELENEDKVVRVRKITTESQKDEGEKVRKTKTN